MRIVLDVQGAQNESRFRGIGRYSLELAQAIAREAGQHEVWLALSGRFVDSIEPLRAKFANLVPAKRIRVFDLPGPVAELDPVNAWRMKAAELLREKFLADLRPDIVHISTLFEGFHNEVVASVGRLDRAIPTAVTLYDLIPMLHPANYHSNASAVGAYFRRAQSLKSAELLLAISTSSAHEAIDTLDILPGRIVTIGAGVNPWFRQVDITPDAKGALMARCRLQRPFLLYTGLADPRKNLERLILAFALLPEELRTTYQLAIVGKLHDEGRELLSLGQKHGLNNADVVCVDYVPDDDMRLLYNACALFISSSPHEGFSLTLLEAMACGAPVIGSNCTGVPKIIDREDATFDPDQPRDIARQIAEVLLNAALRQSLKAWGLEKAKAFTWEACARKALRAFETLHAGRQGAQAATLCSASRRRPLLAFVAPLPPEPTWVAAYSAKLLPSLARQYEVICIVDQLKVSDPWITAEFQIRDVRWFESNIRNFERVLYQFGNSPSHKHLFDLLERHPGVAVLHDFYLADLLNWMDTEHMPACFTKALYDSHGFSALERDRSSGREATMAAYPCNSFVLRNSVGVIVHSEHAVELARHWYGDRVSALMRRVPFLPFPPEATDRLAARTRLGLPENAFVVSSFGFRSPVKLNHRLLEAWLASTLSQDEACFLVFVGENHGGDYGRQFLEKIAESSAAPRIRIARYVEEPHYRDYLAAADLGVQLRTGGKGETSATIFDCLASNVPLVISAHGSGTELPDDVVLKLDDDFADAELTAALTRLHTDPNLRRNLAQRGASYLKEQHHPERIAELYRDTIEELYDTSSVAREQTLLRAIARTSTPARPSDSDLAAVAAVIAANRERLGPRQMLVDVTRLAEFDVRTGIQRVTRAILMALISDPPPGYRIEPIRAVDDGYVYARRLTCQSLGLPERALTDDPVETDRDDIFLGLDLSLFPVPALKPWFLSQRKHGVQIVFVVYDLLPLLRPECFLRFQLQPVFLEWLNTIAEIADGMVCISHAVADELHAWLAKSKARRLQSIWFGFFHLGADLRASLPSKGVSEDALAIAARLRSRPSFLMVGTLEPRKGYRQALAAIEQLWAAGVDTNLVIIGQLGWDIDDLARRIQEHPENNKRLFWLSGVSDEMLEQVYRSAHALLAASEGEGFGLPLIEAAHHGLPIIARDIPVFREVAGEYAYYFRGEDPQNLADALRNWLSLGDAVPASSNLPWMTWQQSSRQLLEVVLGGRRITCWPDANHILQSASEAARSLDVTSDGPARGA